MLNLASQNRTIILKIRIVGYNYSKYEAYWLKQICMPTLQGITYMTTYVKDFPSKKMGGATAE